MPTNVIGSMSVAEQKRVRDNLTLLFDRMLRRGKKLTVGTLVSEARTKQYPENPIAGQTVRIMFVVDVKLREFEGQPIALDCYIANQALQLVTGSDAVGTPVTVEVSASGTCTVIARAAYTTPEQSQEFFAVNDINGVDMSFAYGLRTREVDDLDSGLLTRINAWRATNGKAALLAGAIYLEDPTISFHGPDYYPAYISPSDGGRFVTTLAGLTCAVQATRIDPWDGMTASEQEAWWSGVAVGFAGQDPWDATIRKLVCA